jgi:hypothetical protein
MCQQNKIARYRVKSFILSAIAFDKASANPEALLFLIDSTLTKLIAANLLLLRVTAAVDTDLLLVDVVHTHTRAGH